MKDGKKGSELTSRQVKGLQLKLARPPEGSPALVSLEKKTGSNKLFSTEEGP